MQFERDLSKFLILSLYGAIIADVLTHGQWAVALGNVLGGILKSGFRAAAGQKIS